MVLTLFLNLKVRKSACDALYNLPILSTKFAGEALNLLMDVLNDDSVSVRLQALETLHHMAMSKCLKLQEAHMHMVQLILILCFEVFQLLGIGVQ